MKTNIKTNDWDTHSFNSQLPLKGNLSEILPQTLRINTTTNRGETNFIRATKNASKGPITSGLFTVAPPAFITILLLISERYP
ncbi:MAG: hypothetical protein AAFO99_03070, partial [Bacteroidota bacterium]